MQIEFIGLPGSGKSTISESVMAELRKTNYDVMDRQLQQEFVAEHYRNMSKKERLSSFLSFCEINDALVFELTRLTYALKPIHRAGLRRSFIFLKQCQNASIFCSSDQIPADIVIHDQDIIQELWSVLYLREASDTQIRAVIAEMKDWLPALTVYIDLSGKVAWDRMQQRAQNLNRFTGEIDSMKNLDARTLDQSNVATRRLGEIAEEFGSTLLTIDGMAGVEESANLVLEKIENLFHA